MRLAIAGPNEGLHFVSEGKQSKQVALTLCGESEHQGCRNETLENRIHAVLRGPPRGKSRCIDDNVDFLRSLDLKNLRDRFGAASRRFPVNLIEAVARSIFAQFFKITAFADLAMAMEARRSAIEEQRCEVPTFCKQVRIHPNFALDGKG